MQYVCSTPLCICDKVLFSFHTDVHAPVTDPLGKTAGKVQGRGCSTYTVAQTGSNASRSSSTTYQVAPFKGTLHCSLDTACLLVMVQSKLQNRQMDTVTRGVVITQSHSHNEQRELPLTEATHQYGAAS